jgi:hypothetical protein
MALHRRMVPHSTVHGGSEDYRGSCRQQESAQEIVCQSQCRFCEQMGGRWGDQDHIGLFS